ncbi:MAG: type II toxin-antitoxin system RelE/ParE family toxin [Xanthomonadales bacterium]|nr:type II toxin-antitoxin system RelE/ParE family toxin [Xanthomonadales bacterium]
MRVDWSRPARDDLVEIRGFISRDSQHYAEQFTRRIVLATRRLRDFPDGGRMIPEVGEHDLREIIVQSYRVMYRRESNRVLILAIMHGARQFTSELLNP